MYQYIFLNKKNQILYNIIYIILNLIKLLFIFYIIKKYCNGKYILKEYLII